MEISGDWEMILSRIDFAFQPIVNIHTGRVFGVEALLRGWDEAGFPSIQAVFDRAFAERYLYAVDLRLRKAALDKFISSGLRGVAKLFYNLDNRVLMMEDYSSGNTIRLMEERRLPPSTLCFEISERHEIACFDGPAAALDAYKQQHFRIAVDDFGSGYSGLQLLYHSQPDMVKIDRFFIEGIERDSKKKLFVANIVNMAHIMGIIVIAEGVETESEFFLCREIGCDFAQGHLVQKPVLAVEELKLKYPIVESLSGKDKRNRETNREIIYRQLETPNAAGIDDPIVSVLERFRSDSNLSYIPVINENREPLGVVREKDLKHYVYSPFGISLLKNEAYGGNLHPFLFKAPIAEIHTRVEKIIELYAVNKETEVVLVTVNGKYHGVLDSRSLIQMLNDKALADARDQNPLSKLPGNNLINGFIADRLDSREGETAFLYFDFDHFKPFNDLYGFRQGDRVILLFADLIREEGRKNGWFVGHVGGDDFFAGITGPSVDIGSVEEHALEIVRRFTDDVRAFYGEEDRKAGFILSKSRDGRKKKYPLLCVSSALIHFSRDGTRPMIEEFSMAIAELKRKAKESPTRIAVLRYGPKAPILPDP